jgi:hypothetical protein
MQCKWLTFRLELDWRTLKKLGAGRGGASVAVWVFCIQKKALTVQTCDSMVECFVPRFIVASSCLYKLCKLISSPPSQFSLVSLPSFLLVYNSIPGIAICLYSAYLHTPSIPSCTSVQKLRDMSPRANYTDRSTAACRQSQCQLLGNAWSEQRFSKPKPIIFLSSSSIVLTRLSGPVPDPLVLR